jgi:hypothetical protein
MIDEDRDWIRDYVPRPKRFKALNRDIEIADHVREFVNPKGFNLTPKQSDVMGEIMINEQDPDYFRVLDRHKKIKKSKAKRCKCK